jgi:hypothetical protein
MKKENESKKKYESNKEEKDAFRETYLYRMMIAEERIESDKRDRQVLKEVIEMCGKGNACQEDAECTDIMV